MRDRSFPIVALKYNFAEKSSSSSIEYHDSENEELSADRYVCPYLHETVKRNILTMASHTPQSVAIRYNLNAKRGSGRQRTIST